MLNRLTLSPPGDRTPGPQTSHAWRSWYGSCRGLLVLGALAGVLAALAVNLNWIAFATLLPLIYLLPCAAMMYVCMRHTKP
jgi:hypothetical protein